MGRATKGLPFFNLRFIGFTTNGLVKTTVSVLFFWRFWFKIIIVKTKENTMKTIGQNIAFYRKEKNVTQEKLAEICSVTPQAVSKWENDVSCPDVTLLKTIAKTFGISVDQLLDDESPITRLDTTTDFSKKFIKIRVVNDSEKVNVNLPLSLLELLLKSDGLANSISIGGKNNLFKTIDFKQVFELVSLGVMGKLVEVEDSSGEKVEVWIE